MKKKIQKKRYWLFQIPKKNRIGIKIIKNYINDVSNF